MFRELSESRRISCFESSRRNLMTLSNVIILVSLWDPVTRSPISVMGLGIRQSPHLLHCLFVVSETDDLTMKSKAVSGFILISTYSTIRNVKKV